MERSQFFTTLCCISNSQPLVKSTELSSPKTALMRLSSALSVALSTDAAPLGPQQSDRCSVVRCGLAARRRHSTVAAVRTRSTSVV